MPHLLKVQLTQGHLSKQYIYLCKRQFHTPETAFVIELNEKFKLFIDFKYLASCLLASILKILKPNF
jgi:hypothetical protein